MRILGVETSCDDTGIAVLEVIESLPRGKAGETPQFRILANVVSSQIKIHREYGGVYPMLAKREHQKNLPIVLKKTLKEAECEKTDAIAVTYGPGLSPCLWTGLNFAKDLAKKWNTPLIPVDHIEAHMLTGMLTQKQSSALTFQQSNIFPAVALIVSGGHTQLVLVKNIGEYQIIGETRDDAAGECFDKTARILGLEYPGGPEIAAAAAKFSISNSQFSIKLPRPMLHTKDYDFSFSGLKTAVLYDYQARPKKERESKAYIQAMAHEIQQAIIDVLVHKTMQAAEEFKTKSIVVGGGVAANESLRARLKESARGASSAMLAPPPGLATDNGLMIALAGYFKYKQGAYPKNPDQIEADPNLRIA